MKHVYSLELVSLCTNTFDIAVQHKRDLQRYVYYLYMHRKTHLQNIHCRLLLIGIYLMMLSQWILYGTVKDSMVIVGEWLYSSTLFSPSTSYCLIYQTYDNNNNNNEYTNPLPLCFLLFLCAYLNTPLSCSFDLLTLILTLFILFQIQYRQSIP